MKRPERKIFLTLFLTTFSLSAFTFGGGYVIITLFKERFVDRLHWLEEGELLDYVAIAQSCPGPIAINGSILVGYRMAGVGGAMIAVTGAVLPPFFILSVLSLCYDAFRANEAAAAMLSGMTAAVGAVIVSVVFDMGKRVLKEGDGLRTAVMAASFFANLALGVNVLWILLAAGLLGAARTVLSERRAGGR